MRGLLLVGTALAGLSGGAAAQALTGPIPWASAGKPGGPAPLDASGRLSGQTTLATGGNTARTLAARAADVFDVRDYGAKCDQATDDGPAFNLALAALRATGGASPPQGKLSWAGCNAVIKTTINATNIKSSDVVFDGAGGLLNGNTPGQPVIDALGSEYLRWHHVSIYGIAAKVGIQIGRTKAGDATDNQVFDALYIIGAFTWAPFYNFGAETTRMNDAFLGNQLTTGVLGSCAALIMDGNNHWHVTSAYATVTASQDTLDSLSQNTFHSLVATTTSANCRPLWLGSTNSDNFEGGYAFSNGGVSVVLYNPTPTSVGSQQAGNVASLHFNNFGSEYNPTDTFLVTGPNATPALYDITFQTGASEATNSIFKLDTGVTSATLIGGKVDVGLFTQTATKTFDDPTKWTVTGDFRYSTTGHWTTPASFSGTVVQGATMTGMMSGELDVGDLSVGGSGPMAGAFTTSNPTPTAQSGTLGANATSTVRIKRLPGRAVAFNVQMTIPNVGSGTGTANLAMPFTTSGATCFGSGRELASNGKHVDFYMGGASSSGSMNYYDGSATLVAGQPTVIFVVTGICETAS